MRYERCRTDAPAPNCRSALGEASWPPARGPANMCALFRAKSAMGGVP